MYLKCRNIKCLMREHYIDNDLAVRETLLFVKLCYCLCFITFFFAGYYESALRFVVCNLDLCLGVSFDFNSEDGFFKKITFPAFLKRSYFIEIQPFHHEMNVSFFSKLKCNFFKINFI